VPYRLTAGRPGADLASTVTCGSGCNPVSDNPAFASTHEALGMLRTVMGYLAAADPTAMAAEAQAECLLALEEMNAVMTATRAKVLSAFTAAQGWTGHGDGLFALAGPGQRTGHRRQRLRPPVRAGDGPGHPPHARRSSTAADAPRCSRDLNRRDHARVVEGPPAPGLATAGPEDRTEITGPANPVAPMNW
jgi:hypothetical protein